MFRAVLFDWDGTLADTRRVIVDSFQKALSEINVRIDASFIERRIGVGGEQTFREIMQHSGIPFDEALIESLMEKKIKAEIDMAGTVKLLPGAKKLLESLQARIKLALATMNNREVIDHMLTAMKLDRFFDVVLAAEEVARFKPDPEIFLKCASRLQISPEECVVVEDSIFGVQAAKAAGMGCIAVLTGVYSREELEGAKPALIVSSLVENEEVLDFILHQ